VHDSLYSADPIKIQVERVDSIEFIHLQHGGMHRIAR
jgi:hypothetical protein